MNQKTYYQTVSVIFALLALAHIWRVYTSAPAVIAGVSVPMWASWAAILIAGYLAMRGWQFAGKKGKR
ncbi:hypothetical protein H7X87_03885 [Acetobacteraceae bacterium]|nr:hypothetical protein [Candidatus Parcubacteria bacterium]